MALPVKLFEITDAFEQLGDENAAYLNRRTGEVYVLADEFSADEFSLDDDEDLDDLPEWLRDEKLKGREIRDSEDWLALPHKTDIHEWQIMDDFCRSLASEAKSKQLMSAIRARGAFRRFRNLADEFGLMEQWNDFRAAAFEQIAVDWLEENKIPYSKESRAARAD